MNAYNELYKFIYMFYFLWNTPFVPDFLEFRSEKGNFIFKVSNIHSYNYEGIYKTKDILVHQTNEVTALSCKAYSLSLKYCSSLNP